MSMRTKTMAPSPMQRSEGGSVPPYLKPRIPAEELRTSSTERTRSPSSASQATPSKPIMVRSNTAPIGRKPSMRGGMPPHLGLRVPRSGKGEAEVPPMPVPSSAVERSQPLLPLAGPVTGAKSDLPPYLGLRIPTYKRPPSPPPPLASKTISSVNAPWLAGGPVEAAHALVRNASKIEREGERKPEKIDLKTRLARTKSVGLPTNPRPVRKGSGDVPVVPPLPELPEEILEKMNESAKDENEAAGATMKEKAKVKTSEEKRAKEKEKAERMGSDVNYAKAMMAQMAREREQELVRNMDIKPKAIVETVDDIFKSMLEKEQQTEADKERVSGIMNISLRSSSTTPAPEARQELTLKNDGAKKVVDDIPENGPDSTLLERIREVNENNPNEANEESREESRITGSLTVKQGKASKVEEKQLPIIPDEQISALEASEAEEVSSWSDESDITFMTIKAEEESFEQEKEIERLGVAKADEEDKFQRTSGSYFSPRKTSKKVSVNDIDALPGSLLNLGVEAAWMQGSLSPLHDCEERELSAMQPSPLRISASASPNTIGKELENVRTTILSIPQYQTKQVESSSSFSPPSSASRASIPSQDFRHDSVFEKLIPHLLSLPSTARRLSPTTRSSFLTAANQGTLTMIMLRLYAVQDRVYLCSELRFLALLLANLVVPHSGGDGGQNLSKRLMDWIMARMMRIRERIDVLEGLVETISRESGDYLDQQTKEECRDGTKMFKSLYEAIGTEIERKKRSVLVGLVMVWAREKSHLESWAGVMSSSPDPAHAPPPVPPPPQANPPSSTPASQDFLTRKFLPTSTSQKSARANEELKIIIDEIWSAQNAISSGQKGFVERRDLKQNSGAGHIRDNIVGEIEIRGIEDIYGMVLDIQARFWADLAE